MADLNKITKQLKEEDVDLDDIKIMNVDEMVELTPDDIKENKLKFTNPDEILDYIKTIKQKLSVEEKSRNEEIGKIDFYLYGDPKDNLTHYKGAIGRLQSWFSNQYLTNSAGRKDADTVVDGFKNIKVLQRQQADTFNKANFKMNYAMRCLDALYNDKFEELTKEIETLKAQLEQNKGIPITNTNTQFQVDIKTYNETPSDEPKSFRNIIQEFMDLYGRPLLNRYMEEIDKRGDFNNASAGAYKSQFKQAAKKFLSTYYQDADVKAIQLFDSLVLARKKKSSSRQADSKGDTQSKINPKPEDVDPPEKEGLYVAESTQLPESSEQDIGRD